MVLGVGACLAATAVAGFSAVDPDEITCRELIDSPDKLRETTLKLAQDDVDAKVRYEGEIERICAGAPRGFRPVQQVKPEEVGVPRTTSTDIPGSSAEWSTRPKAAGSPCA